MTSTQSSTAYAELVDRAIARVGLPELARIARDAGLIVPTPEHLRAIVDAAPVAVDAEMEDDEAGFSDLETGFERPAIIAGPVLDENGKSWCDHYRIDPAPAAVDTGRAHGPALSRNTVGRAYMAEAKTMHREQLCMAVLDAIVGDDLNSIAVRMYVQEMADRLRDFDRQQSPAAIIAAAQAEGRALTTRDACALCALIDTVHCPDCRAVTEPDDNFCPACGNGLDAIRESLA